MADMSRMQNQVGEKAPKYRASCDACNEAKVRCSQTRPSCARCLKNQNRRCVYGVSKRSGKHNGEISAKGEGGAKKGTVSRPPATPTSATSVETPSSSSSTIDPREFLQMFPASHTEPSELLKGQQLPKDWAFDNNLFMPTQPIASPDSPTNYDQYQLMFGRDESNLSNIQHHGLGLFDGASEVELGSISRDDSLGDQTSSYTQSTATTKCASCSISTRQNGSSASLVDHTCRCNEVIITQLSSLPVLLDNGRSTTLDVELVQFQKAIKLCAGALACTCPGRDYTSILTISMLIARIISVFERSGGGGGGAHQTGHNHNHHSPSHHHHRQPYDNDDNSSAPSLIMSAGAATTMTPIPSPKFSVGIYEIEQEDENNLKREVWWIQIKKVESLVAGFRDMVAKMTTMTMTSPQMKETWEKLALVLEQKAQAVKRDWRAYRDKA